MCEEGDTEGSFSFPELRVLPGPERTGWLGLEAGGQWPRSSQLPLLGLGSAFRLCPGLMASSLLRVWGQRHQSHCQPPNLQVLVPFCGANNACGQRAWLSISSTLIHCLFLFLT